MNIDRIKCRNAALTKRQTRRKTGTQSYGPKAMPWRPGCRKKALFLYLIDYCASPGIPEARFLFVLTGPGRITSFRQRLQQRAKYSRKAFFHALHGEHIRRSFLFRLYSRQGPIVSRRTMGSLYSLYSDGSIRPYLFCAAGYRQ